MHSAARPVAALVVLTLLLAGCGGSDDEPSPRPSATASATTTAAPATTPGRVRPARVFDARDAASFAELAGAIGGEIGVVAGPPGAARPQQLGSLADGDAWSTIKVAIALRVNQAAGGAPSAEQRDLIARALTASDNAAADQLFASLGDSDTARAAAVQEVLRAAGDSETVVSDEGRDGFSPYGQTDWPLIAQQRFMAVLVGGCLPDDAGADLVLEQMGQVVPDQRWGLGGVGERPRFKGGWGPGTDGRYLIRQMGVVEIGGRPVVVAIAALPEDGQFATGTNMLDQIAAWLADNATPVRSAGC